MKTTSFAIANYCVPCNAHCRHCLLSSCGKATGIDSATYYSDGNRNILKIPAIQYTICTTKPIVSAYIHRIRRGALHEHNRSYRNPG
jgi:hypothetical protein